MPEFVYIARNASGQDVTGTTTAGSKRDILRMLAEKSLFPLKVDSVEETKPGLHFKFQGRIKPQLIATNLIQLSDLLHNGVPLLSALELLVEQSVHPRLGEIFGDIRDRVAEGTSLDEAFAAYPKVFNELTVSMVRAGSEGAFLEDALKRTADFLDLQEQLKGRVVGAMAYPAFLAVAGFTVLIVLLVFFVPKFAELFARLEKTGEGLPVPTVILLWLSGFLGRYGLLILGAAVAAGVGVRRWTRSAAGHLFIDRWKLKLPIFGPIFLNSAVSRFCRVLGTLLHNGVSLLKALEIASDSAGNRVLSAALRRSAENVSSGETLAKPLAACGLIPRSLMAMITIAEESNNLDNVLINIADRTDATIARQLDIMVRLIEPLLLVIMGVVIMFVLVALLLPVFDMSSAMG